MKASLKQALSFGLMATLALPAVLPVMAAEQAATSDSKTQEAAKSNEVAKPSSGTYSEFDSRMVAVEHRIIEDLSDGKLSPQDAEDLKSAYDQIAETEALFRQHPAKFTQWQLTKLHVMLDNLSEAISAAEHDRDLASADLQFTREDLRRRIDNAAKNGRLTPQEVSDLKARFNKIVSMELQLERSQKRLTYMDKLALCIDYDNLAARMHRDISARAIAAPDVSAIDAIEKRIEEGTKSGKISASKSDELKKRLGELKSMAENFKKPEKNQAVDQIIGSVYYHKSPQISLGLAMEDLANQVELLIEPAKDISTRLKDIDAKLSQALDDGTLNPLETVELKEDFDSIVDAKDKSGSTLKEEDELALKLDMARLEGRIDRQIHAPNRLWAGIVVGITHLSDRNKQSLKAKRLSEEQSKDFLKELSLLNKKRSDFTKQSGGMTVAQAVQVAQELQSLGGKLDKQTKDRDLELPNIDNLRSAIDNRIGESAALGLLGAGDVRSAILTLGELNSVKEKYAASENELSVREKFAIAFELERMATDVEEEIHGHEAFYPGLEKRRNQIESLINEGISSGRLNSANADIYRQKLAENKNLEKEYRSSSIGLTGDKALELINSLEKSWLQLDRELRDKQVMTSDIVSLQGNVEKKIRQGFSDGVLTPSEAETLRGMYDTITAAFALLRAADGGLSYGERLALEYAYQRLEANVERNVRVVPMTIPMMDKAHADLEQKLGNLLATGRLSPDTTLELKKKLDKLGASVSDKRASGGGLSYQEYLVVAVDMHRLNKQIEEAAAKLKSPLPDIDALQAALEKKLEEGKTKGTLSASAYKDAKDEMSRIQANEAAFRISDESLNYAEALNLMQAIQALSDRISGKAKSESSTTKTKSATDSKSKTSETASKSSSTKTTSKTTESKKKETK